MATIDAAIVGTAEARCAWCKARGPMTKHHVVEELAGLPVKTAIVLRCAACARVSREPSLLMRVVLLALFVPMVAILTGAIYLASRGLLAVIAGLSSESLPLLGGLVALLAIAGWSLFKLLAGIRRLATGAPARVDEHGTTGL